MKKQSIKPVLIEAICFLFILLWTYAAVSKWIDWNKFYGQLNQSPLLMPFAKMTVIGVPLLECLLSFCLLLPRCQLLALYGSFTLMCAFTFYILAITRFSDYVPCSCGGILEQMSWNAHLWFNISFVALGVLGVLFYPRPKALLQ